MRVLLVTNVFPPAIGGPATFGARLAEELTKCGHKVKVVCATASSELNYKFSFQVIRTGYSGNVLQREISLRMHLLKATVSSDIIYCMGLEHQTEWACRMTRKLFTLRIGGDSVWEGARNLGATDLEPEDFYTKNSAEDRHYVKVPEQRRLAQLHAATSVVYVSKYLQKLAGVWCSKRSTHECVIPNGISADALKEFPARKRDEPLRLLFVGRQTNWKGVDVILLAINEIEGVKLTVAGSGPVLPANIDLARRLGLGEKVEFSGHVDPVDVAKLMTRNHVLILPSLYEGMSNTLLEAGIAGLACISSDRGGNPEVIINNKTGLLVDPFSLEAMIHAINQLTKDESERLRLADGHRKRVLSKFTLDTSVQRTIQVLEGACNH